MPLRRGLSLRAPPAPGCDLAPGWEAAGRAGPGAAASGRRNFLSRPRAAAAGAAVRPAPVPRNRGRARRVRAAGASRCARSWESWGTRGFCGSILTGPVALNPRCPGTPWASP